MIDYTLILNRKYPETSWTLNGDNYDGLKWLDDSRKPTKDELDALWDTVKNEIKAEIENAQVAKAALLQRLGITAEEAALLLS